MRPSHLLDRSLFDFTKIAATDEPKLTPIHPRLVPRAACPRNRMTLKQINSTKKITSFHPPQRH